MTQSTSPQVFNFLQEHPQEVFHVSVMAKSLDMDVNTATNAAAWLARQPDIPVERVKRGMYRYTGEGSGIEIPVNSKGEYDPEPIPRPVAIARSMSGKYIVTLENGAAIIGDLI